jgi:hypothetical protein
MRIRRIASVFLLAAWSAGLAAAESPQDAFTRTWVGRTVVVRQALYTLAFDERGLLGQTRRDKREGLNVVTPFNGSFFQFDGRQKSDDVVDGDPQRLVDKVNTTYQSDSVSVRSYRKIEPQLLHRYDPGVELIVGKVRLLLVDAKKDFGDEPAATLTVRWPSPFSRAFTERDVVEKLILQYLRVK